LKKVEGAHGDGSQSTEVTMGRKKVKYDPAFKARIALEAVKEAESLAQIGQRSGVQLVLVDQWKATTSAARKERN